MSDKTRLLPDSGGSFIRAGDGSLKPASSSETAPVPLALAPDGDVPQEKAPAAKAGKPAVKEA